MQGLHSAFLRLWRRGPQTETETAKPLADEPKEQAEDGEDGLSKEASAQVCGMCVCKCPGGGADLMDSPCVCRQGMCVCTQKPVQTAQQDQQVLIIMHTACG